MSGSEASGGARTGKIVRVLDLAIEYGIYLYVFALFNQGTTALSNLGLYVPLFAWIAKSFLLRGANLGYLRHPVAMAFIAFAAAILAASIYSPDPIYSLDSYRKSIGAAAGLAVVMGDSFREQRKLSRLLYALVLSGAYVTGLNVLQYAREYVQQGAFPEDISVHRWFGDPAIFFAFFTLGLAVGGRGWKRSLAWGLFGIQVALLLPTGARGSWLAFAASLAVWLAYGADRRVVLATGIGVAAAAIAAVTVLPSSTIVDRIHHGTNTSLRTTGTWGPAYEMIVEKPLLGYGYGRQVFNNEFNARAPARPWWSFQTSHGPHSNYLEIAFAAGVPGFVTLVACYALLVGALARLTGSGPPGEMRWIALATLCAFVAFYLVRGFVESSRWQPLGVLVGIAIAVLVAGRTAEVARSEK